MLNLDKLLIAGINEDITGTLPERLQEVRKRFESEMLWEKGPQPQTRIQQRLYDWLQGLCSTISIPFYNSDILDWYEQQVQRQAKNDHECHRWVEAYWHNASVTLYRLLYT